MNKERAQDLLREKGSHFSDNQWRILETLVACESDPSHASLADHCRSHAAEVVELLTRKGALCSWAVYACPSLQDAPDDIRDALHKAAQFEFAACARRKLALNQLNELAEKTNCTPIVFKGASNSLTYYDKESIRPSVDIDVMMAYEDMARCFPTELAEWNARFPEQWVRNLPRLSTISYPTEVHFCFVSPSTWGKYDDLAKDSLPLGDYSHLRQPSARVALTLALIHFAHHEGRSIFDVLDVMHILKADDACIENATEYWKDEEIVQLVVPGLTVLDTIVPLISSEAWAGLFDSMNSRHKSDMTRGLKLPSQHRFSTLRDTWHWSRITGFSLSRILIHRLVGKKELTESITGLQPKQPAFWFYHLLGLPMKRLLRFWQ